jgi:hypothetical protein
MRESDNEKYPTLKLTDTANNDNNSEFDHPNSELCYKLDAVTNTYIKMLVHRRIGIAGEEQVPGYASPRVVQLRHAPRTSAGKSAAVPVGSPGLHRRHRVSSSRRREVSVVSTCPLLSPESSEPVRHPSLV